MGTFDATVAKPVPAPKLRKENRIRTIRDSLAIEGNKLSREQVTAILEGRRVLGAPRDILEVTNAVRAYERSDAFDPYAEESLLRAHAVFMRGLVTETGKYRSGGVGILKGSRVTHVAPPAKRVPGAMRDLFAFLRRDLETPALVRAVVFHYELEFIHPFTDGNGRLGRFWQHLLSRKAFPIFEYVPVESLVRARQDDYYEALERSDRSGTCDRFIELMLSIALEGVSELAPELRSATVTAKDRLERARQKLGRRWFSRKEYRALFPELSTATASRDLRGGVDSGRLVLRGTRRLSEYRFAGRS
ncbi:MAG TPA: Fic family protein [Polyangiaceae bacterium]|nr:Fic family protein [Polyangiaceae bacterium]